MTFELNEGEANALLQLIHIAVQARGMEVAEVGVHFTKKIGAAAEAAQAAAEAAKSPAPSKEAA